MKKILILALSLSILPVFAADWMEIGNKAYVDLSSIKDEGGYIYALKKVMDGAAMKPVNGKKAGWYTSYDAYDCTNKKYQNKTVVSYGFDGQVLEKINYTGGSWKNATPETKDALWLEEICRVSKLPRQGY